MRYISLLPLIFHLLFFTSKVAAQPELIYSNFIEEEKRTSYQHLNLENDKYYANDSSYDIQFYHLQLKPSLDSIFLSGKVVYIASVVADSINRLILDMSSDLQIDSFQGCVDGFTSEANLLYLSLDKTYFKDDKLQFSLTFHGKPSLLNETKGLVYHPGNENKAMIASLSTPYLAHRWWPCKDGPEDKADSVYIDITIPDSLINDVQLKAISNGVLEAVEQSEGNITFYWRHRYPIVPYYIMLAIGGYEHFSQNYSSKHYRDFPLDYYVFPDYYEASVEGVSDLPEAMQYFESVFGPYPFANEKYGMTQLGFYGAIENQTNTIINRMTTDYFIVAVHELAHMWFADMITCKDWREAWLNEGFASYAECLWLEHKEGIGSYKNRMNSKRYYNGGSLYLADDKDPFNIFIGIIYQKGAWVLHMLRAILSDAVFFKCLNDYAGSPIFQYGHASTNDFKNICENNSGLNLDAFFTQWIYGDYYPEYSYNFKQDQNGFCDLFISQNQQEKLGSNSIFEMPVQLLFQFQDGSDTLIIVDNDEKYQQYNFQFEKEIYLVELDPNELILCKKQRDLSLNVDWLNLKYETELSIYPNPVRSGSSILIESKQLNSSSIEIRTLSGRLVEKFTTGSAKERISYFLDKNRYVKGSYIVSLIGKNRVFSTLLLVE